MKKNKRCLIEVDGCIDDGWCGQYSRFKENSLKGIEINEFFNTIVVGALDNKLAVLDAIYDSDEIWVSSCFIGGSGRLLTEMLSKGVELDIKNKKVVNIRKWDDVSWHVTDEAMLLIKQLEAENNVVFIYSDDIEYKSLFNNLNDE